MTTTTKNEATTPGDVGDGLRRDQSLAKNLFFGEIAEDNLFPYPQINARDSELLGAMVDAIDGFLADKQADLKHWDREAHQPEEFIQGLRDMGLFGLIIPEAEGGLGLSNAGYARVLEQTSSHDSSVSLTIGAHSSIGMKGLLLFGTPGQRARYLPRLASGELIAAFCLTESGAGSDAASLRTKATRNDDGSWVLNGEKIWITNGGIAGFYTVFARSDTPEGKITAFLVEAGWPGVSHGPHEDKMGIRASSTTTVAFADVPVPPETVPGGVGKGLVARKIHGLGPRRHGPFVAINCAALVETLIEAELFGIEERTATGVRGRRGKFEHAEGGTLFLSEIPDRSAAAQAKLRPVLQVPTVRRVRRPNSEGLAPRSAGSST